MQSSAGSAHVSTRAPNHSLLPSPQQLAYNAASWDALLTGVDNVWVGDAA